MNNDEQKNGVCMACACPCEAHKEHNHPMPKEGKHEHGEVCTDCAEKKEEVSCGCGK
jgi:hypothetical protein